MKIHYLVLGEINTNTYIIEGTTGAVVIDPAAEYEKISEFLKGLGKKAEYVLLTHAYFDHCGAAAELQKDGAEIYMSRKDAEMLRMGKHLAYAGMDFKMFVPDRLLDGGEKLSLCGMEFEVIATPGHTAGGLSYIIDKNIFCGDTLFRRGIGRTDLYSGSYTDIIKSLKKLLAMSGEYNVYPGHEEFTTLSYERENNPYVDL